jgi:hypothetical protein
LAAGLLAVAASCAVAIYAHLPPLGDLHVERGEEILGLLIFAASGVVVAVIGSLARHGLELVAAGLSNETIASSLGLSVNTIKTHLKDVYGKLEVTSRTQAIARAGALGILATIAGAADLPEARAVA